MRIAYLGQMADVATENGISKKIRAQTAPWRAAGHDVRYFSLVPTTTTWPGLVPLEMHLVARGGPALRAFRSLELARHVRAWRPDVIYFRFGYHSAGLPALFRAIPTVAEINSDDLAEYPLTLSRAKVWYHRLTRKRVLGAVRGFVAVTHELAERFRPFGHATEVIANGIDLAAFAPAPLPPAGAPRLCFIGNTGSPWHGLERMAELATLFPDTTIDVIGWTADQWRDAAPATPPPPNVRLHGMLPRARYEPLVHAATAAIATLALFRNGMHEACPLKVREYLASGLPVIAAFRDPDIADDAEHFFRLPNDASPLSPHRERIATWLARWRERRVPRATIAHLDNTAKENRRLAFLARLAGCEPARS